MTKHFVTKITKTLTDQEKEFVRLVGSGNLPSLSAESAGFKNGTDSASYLMRKPAVAAAIEHELRRVLSAEVAPEAFAFLRKILKDDKVKPETRVIAAKTLLDRAGYVAPKAPESAVQEHKDLGEMDTSELEQVVSELGKELDARATNSRDITPTDKPGDSQLSDLY